MKRPRVWVCPDPRQVAIGTKPQFAAILKEYQGTHQPKFVSGPSWDLSIIYKQPITRIEIDIRG